MKPIKIYSNEYKDFKIFNTYYVITDSLQIVAFDIAIEPFREPWGMANEYLLGINKRIKGFFGRRDFAEKWLSFYKKEITRKQLYEFLDDYISS